MIDKWKDIQRELSAPFAADEIEWKPQASNEKKNRALAVAYINARAVMDRLDAVVGAGKWSDSYRVLPNGKNVECTLTVKGVSKSDVGEPNQGGFSDPHKSAYSDALKRAAVKFGIGRYLYNLPTQWVGCKPQGKSVVLTETPALPPWATPDGEGRPPKRANGDSRAEASPQAQAKRKRPKGKPKTDPAGARNAEDARDALQQAARQNGDPASDKQLKYVRSSMSSLMENDYDKAKLLLVYLFGIDSSSELTKGQASALIDWIGANAGNDYTPTEAAQLEANRMLKAFEIERGQGQLALDDAEAEKEAA